MTAEEKARLIGNLVGTMQGVPRNIQLRQVRHSIRPTRPTARRRGQGLGIDVKHVKAA